MKGKYIENQSHMEVTEVTKTANGAECVVGRPAPTRRKCCGAPSVQAWNTRPNVAEQTHEARPVEEIEREYALIFRLYLNADPRNAQENRLLKNRCHELLRELRAAKRLLAGTPANKSHANQNENAGTQEPPKTSGFPPLRRGDGF